MTRLANVFLVEDNPHDVELFKIFLMEEEGIEMQLTVAESGEELLEKLRDSTQPLPDILLLDVNMPRMDGFEVLREIRETLGLKDLAVSILTTSDDEQDIERALKEGANHYMLKPADYDQIHQLVEEMSNLTWNKKEGKKQLIYQNQEYIEQLFNVK